MRWTAGVRTCSRVVLATLTAASISLASVGCVGPIWSTVDLRGAETALEQARTAKADELAPYEYNRALELYKKAREEWGYSEFGKSRRYAEAAKALAEEAREKATVDPWTGPPEAAIETSP